MTAFSTEELKKWLALWRAHSVGPATFFNLLNHFPNFQELFPINKNELAEKGYTEKLVNSLKQIDWKAVDKDLAWLEKENRHIITFYDPEYPFLLKQISYPPPLLFVEGDKTLLNHKQLAIVGSRNASVNGMETAYQFAAKLTLEGLMITSGLALGIDAASHQGALSIPSGKTIAVMGTGPDIIYPHSQYNLAQQIKQSGVLVTEFPTGVKPKPQNFPRRNRILSGLSIGILIVEASFKSGSLITAKYGIEQNRDVFAIPGSIHQPMAKGCHYLIKQGAKLIESVNDILEEYGNFSIENSSVTVSQQEKTVTSTNRNAMINFIDYAPTPIQLIVHRSGLSVEEVSSFLLLLELEKKVKQVVGGYIRTDF
ncbi:MAG: hypothetical protein LEGION0398_MBIBDBAK_00081 [Legionellaceae bacterium]